MALYNGTFVGYNLCEAKVRRGAIAYDRQGQFVEPATTVRAEAFVFARGNDALLPHFKAPVLPRGFPDGFEGSRTRTRY